MSAPAYHDAKRRRRQQEHAERKRQEREDASPNGSFGARDRYQAQSEAGEPKIQPFPFTLARDLKLNLTNSDIVKDLIPRGAFGEVHADSSGGKTAIIVDLMLHIAAGLEYRGRRVEMQPVVYIALEGHAGIDNRIIAARDHLSLMPDIALALVKATDNFRDPMPAQHAAANANFMLKEFGGNCPIIVLDTYQAALGNGGSDCDPKDVSGFISHVQGNLLGAGFTVIILHHFGKDASRGGRGWSGLRASLDFELEIDCDEDLRTMRVTKSRDGSDRQPASCYRFDARELGVKTMGSQLPPWLSFTLQTRPRQSAAIE